MKDHTDTMTSSYTTLAGQLDVAAGNLARVDGDFHHAGLARVAAAAIRELLAERAGLMQSVARQVTAAAPPEEDEPHVADTGKASGHRHKFVGDPPVCSICSQPKKKGGRPPSAAPAATWEGDNPDRASSREPALAGKADGPSEALPLAAAPAAPKAKLIGDAKADRLVGGPV